jgi:hypothetical protein
MGGRIRGLGTSESWFSLGGRIRCLGTREFWFSLLYSFYTEQLCVLYLDGGKYLFWSVFCWFYIVVSFFKKCDFDF